MTTFERGFIIKCLETLNHILSNEDELRQAIQTFTQNDPSNPRYQLNSKVTDAICWSPGELSQFSAAYSEAIFRVMKSYSHDKKAPIETMNTALDLLEREYIHKITSNTKSLERIKSVIENIKEIEATEFKSSKMLRAEMEPGTTQTPVSPFSFFFTPKVTAGVLATASVAAAIYLSQRSGGS